MPYLYLIHTRASLNCNEPVYKVGKTTDFNKRLSGYDKGSEPILVLYVGDCDKFERIILDIFNTQFKKRGDYGNEYFEGEVSQMIKIIMDRFNEENMCYSFGESVKSERKIVNSCEPEFIQKRNSLIKTMNKINEKNIDKTMNDLRMIISGIKTPEFCQVVNNLQNALNDYSYYYHPMNVKNRHTYIPKKMGDYFEYKYPNVSYEITNNYLNNHHEDSKKIYDMFKCVI